MTAYCSVSMIDTLGAPGMAVYRRVPARFAVLSGPMLLPGRLGSYAIRDGVDPRNTFVDDPSAPTWWIACRPGSPDPMCAVDGEPDGWPSHVDHGVRSGDCDDAASGVNPEMPDPGPWAPGAVDTNCDGWPSPGFFEENGGN